MGDLRWLVGVLAGGVALGAAWRLLVPSVVGGSDVAEAAVAADGTLAALGALAGAVTGLALLARPGPVPARRLVVVLLCCCAGSALAWLTGTLLGAPVLRAPASAFVWPVTASGLVCLVTGLRILLTRDRR